MFTEAQKLSIAKIVPMTPTLLNAHLSSLGATLTAEVETEVIAEIARHTSGTVGGVVWFTPTESNEGFNLSKTTNAGNASPSTNIRLLLEIPAEICGASNEGCGTIQIGL